MKMIKNKRLICSLAVIVIVIHFFAVMNLNQEPTKVAKPITGIGTTQIIEEISETTTEVIEITTEQIEEQMTEKSIESDVTIPEQIKEYPPEYEALYSASEFMQLGVINWNGWKWTWYSEKVLAGGGLDIPDRHADSNGYICDGNDYICLASSVLKKGTVVPTPFGKDGKVYDSGCANDVLDVYVSW